MSLLQTSCLKNELKATSLIFTSELATIPCCAFEKREFRWGTIPGFYLSPNLKNLSRVLPSSLVAMSVATRTRSALRSSGGSPAPGLGGSGSASESPARGRRSSSALSSSSDEKDYTPTWPWHAYLTREGVANVKVYQYHGVDNSLIAKYIMQPFWKFSVNYLPIWLA